jgi:hypothetical protein
MKVKDDDGNLSVELVVKLLKIHAESVLRSLGLLPVSGRFVQDPCLGVMGILSVSPSLLYLTNSRFDYLPAN